MEEASWCVWGAPRVHATNLKLFLHPLGTIVQYHRPHAGITPPIETHPVEEIVPAGRGPDGQQQDGQRHHIRLKP